jgi:hypothetical protein
MLTDGMSPAESVDQNGPIFSLFSGLKRNYRDVDQEKPEFKSGVKNWY